MAEVEETSSASGGADLSSSAKMICFSPTSSGPFSWTNSTSITASLRLAATETRATAPSGSLASPWRASACNSSRISRGAAAKVGTCGSVSRTFHPARAKIAAQARPIRPVPTMATLRSVLAICWSHNSFLTARAPCGASRDRHAMPWTVLDGSPGRAPAPPWCRTMPAPDRGCDRR